MKWTDLPENYRTAIAHTMGTTRSDIRKQVTDVRVPVSGNLQGEGYLVELENGDDLLHVYPWGGSVRVRQIA